MERIYLDNAASTPLLPAVFEAMQPYLQAVGNPSSVHYEGRLLRVAVEEARRKLADNLDVSPSEVFFTSCATEANNWALWLAIEAWEVSHVCSTVLEHPSMLNPLQHWSKKKRITHHHIPHQKNGQIALEDMEQLLLTLGNRYPKENVLVTLMHVQNEIGTIYDIEAIGQLCHTHNVYFHSDMVQSAGHMPLCLSQLPLHMASISAHKFHGPKGIGALYIKSNQRTCALLIGGAQERHLRAGTENVAYAVGMAAALQHMCAHMSAYARHGQQLKALLVQNLCEKFPLIHFNGESLNQDTSLWTILSFTLPEDYLTMDAETLLMCLDMKGVSVSIGSACASGAWRSSHVLEAISTEKTPTIRCSFSPFNTEQQVHTFCEILHQIVIKKKNVEQ